MVLKALLIGLFCWLGSYENCQPLGVTFSGALSRPIIGGMIVGIILGCPAEGVIMGATIQSMYLANVVIGGVASADMTFVAYPSIALALLAGASAEVAMTIAATVGIIGAAIFTLYETICSVFFALGDKAIAKGDIRAMKISYTVLPPLLSLLIRGGVTASIVLLGSEYAAKLLASIPQVILDIAGVLGGMLPAVGMSILLAYTLKDMKMIIWFVIGIIGISLLGLNMVAVAVLGGCLAVMYYMFTTRTATAVASNDDEEEF